jgi:carbon storage regulator
MPLVLSRKTGEAVQIGPDISIVVLDVKDGRVSLGIKAPKDVPVHREEVVRRIEREKKEQK